MTTQGELPDIVERLRDVEWRAIEFSQGWGAGGAHGKMMAAFAITEIERLRATPPGSPLEREDDERHYLSAIRKRLEQLYDASADNPRLREQLSDEVDWVDAKLTPPQVQQSARGSEG